MREVCTSDEKLKAQPLREYSKHIASEHQYGANSSWPDICPRSGTYQTSSSGARLGIIPYRSRSEERS